MESNAFEKSANKCCLKIFLHVVLIFPKNFLGFKFDATEKQSIINISSYCNKNYVSVVLRNSEATFLVEEEKAAL